MEGADGVAPDWRALWLAEIARLEEFAQEQGPKDGAQEWYRMMYYRIVRAFAPDPYAPHPGMAEQSMQAAGPSGTGEEGEQDELEEGDEDD